MSVDTTSTSIDEEAATEAALAADAPLLEEELLVEEVSIDGMCGVY
ncbi:MAG TPA: mycofactocin precursor MftA [Microthrixaceae bacterium]|nr:mycofactocin precursor MftA [Microthrixaceae bacterium]